MIRKAYEITCDACGSTEPIHAETKQQARDSFIGNGWIITGTGHTFCDTKCRQAFQVRTSGNPKKQSSTP